jgi:NADH-quinone oxidoreductase subunit J
MIGAIVLTHRSRGDTRTPKASRQLRRRPDQAVKVTQPGIGEGMKL